MIYRLVVLVSLFVCISCTKKNSVNTDETEVEAPNILLIIADDMGLDATPGYDIGTVKPNMPTLQNMLDSGIRFNNVWAYPVCTPTRASILTGKFGLRTNVQKVGDILSTSETSLHTYIDENSPHDYASSLIGKWHLSSDPSHPNELGIDYYAGLLSGAVQSYTTWNFTENGNTSVSNDYTTTKFTDLAIDWVQDQDEPWFLWLAYNAPHTPFHLPPTALHYQGDLPTDEASIDANPLPYYMAMIEAMDTEMGRLIDSISEEERENTIIIFVGDNGTTGAVAQQYNSNRVKGSVYKGGINVPMVISGKGVTRINDSENALISTVDLFATIAELTGIDLSTSNDSHSFKSLLTSSNASSQDFIFSELGTNSGGTDSTIRNGTHKYILFDEGNEALFNLSLSPFERPNLLSEDQLPLSENDSAILEELKNELQEIKN